MTGRPAGLAQTERELLFTTQIAPRLAQGAVAQEQPVAVLVIGQPGSGKTTAATLIKAVLDRRGGAVHAAGDPLKPFHPQHGDEGLPQDGHAAGPLIRVDVRQWQEQLEALARVEQYDIVAEHSPTDTAAFLTRLRAYRAAGYRVEIVAMAAAQACTQLGVVERFLDQTRQEDSGRWVAWDNHDACTLGVLDALVGTEAARLADLITVLDQAGNTLYASGDPSGRWPAGSAAGAVQAEHERPWTAAETLVFHRRHAVARTQLASPHVPEERRPAVAAAVERAAAFAEPRRRTAQAHPGWNGVDFHRLSDFEHREIFQKVIAPAYLDLVVRQEQPVVVYVMGQPGSGKTNLAATVLRALARRGAATPVSADKMKAAHPDYYDLSLSHARAAGDLIRADVKLWQAQVEEGVRQRRGDAVIETSPGTPGQFLDSATRFHRAGYRVVVVAMAVRAADSRQGTALRAARNQELFGHVARFTSAAGHDRCYEGVAAAVHAAETHPAVHTLLVVRRGAHLLWHNQQLPDGARLRQARAAWALAAERLRPYTALEATAFLASQQRLRAALPQYWADLDQIEGLARPLLSSRPSERLLRPLALPSGADG